MARYALKYNNEFLVADELGDVTGEGDGLFCNDTRLLSRFNFRVGGQTPSLLSSGVSQDNVYFRANVTNRPLPELGGQLTPEGVIHIERTRLLWELGRQHPVMQRDLADRLKVTPRNVTALVDALVDAGFVRRDPHPSDRRALAVGLTAKGQQTFDTLQGDFVTLAGLMFGNVAQPDLAAFTRVLALAAARLSALAEG